MKKRISSFMAGAGLTLALLACLTTALAASGQVTFNQAGVRLFGEVLTEAGESIQAPNGQPVPSVITYTDPAGGKTNYLSIQQLSKLLDIETTWNGEKNTVDIATWNGKPSAMIRIVGDGENMKVTPGEGVEVSVVSGPEEYPGKPEYGVTHGAYQEIDPASVDISGGPKLTCLQNARIQADGVPPMIYDFIPQQGRHIVFEVTNHGSVAQVVKVARQTTIAASPRESFTAVSVAPGETLTRAFLISEDSSRLERNLLFDIDSAALNTVSDITVSLRQYE